MTKEYDKISQWPDWPKCDVKNQWNFLNPWRDTVSAMIECGEVLRVDAEVDCKARGVSTKSLIKGLGPFWNSHTFQSLLNFSERNDPWPDERMTAFIAGSRGRDVAHSHVTMFDDTRVVHWSQEIAGVWSSSNPDTDIDIYLTSEATKFVLSNFNCSVRDSRSIEGLKLIEVTEKTEDRVLNFQFHYIEGSTLTPAAQAMLSAPDRLHQIGIAMCGISLDMIDQGAYKDGPFEQKPPTYLIDQKNPFSKNTLRTLGGILIFGVMTPEFATKFNDQLSELRDFVQMSLSNINNLSWQVLAEKYKKWNSKKPFRDYEDVYDVSIERFAKLGFMPFFLEKALEVGDDYIVKTILYQTLLYAKILGIPEALQINDDEEIDLFGKHHDDLIQIAKKIDWKQVAEN